MDRSTWILITTMERFELTKQTLESVYRTAPEQPQLIVIDNGSTGPVLDYLWAQFRAGRIHRLICNKKGSVPQWQKSYAINQAVDLLISERKHYEYFGWIDNDMEMRPYWLQSAKSILSELHGIDVVSCHHDTRQEQSHPTQEMLNVLGVDGRVRLKKTCNGAAWMMRKSFFEKWGLPLVGAGKCNEGVEDWYYSYALRKEPVCKFAAIEASEHLGYGESARKLVPHA